MDLTDKWERTQRGRNTQQNHSSGLGSVSIASSIQNPFPLHKKQSGTLERPQLGVESRAPSLASQLSLPPTMCGRQYRVFRCGHRILMPGVTYCPRAGISPRTGRYTMCGVERTVTDVADSNLCGENACYLADLVRQGWWCHVCERRNPPGGYICQAPWNNMGTIEPCGHQVCTTFCRYA